MRPFSFTLGLLLMAFGAFIVYEVNNINSSVVGYIPVVGSGVAGGFILGGGSLLAGICLVIYGARSPKTRLSVDDIKKLGLTGDNIVRGASPPVVAQPGKTEGAPTGPVLSVLELEILTAVYRGQRIRRLRSKLGIDKLEMEKKIDDLKVHGYLSESEKLTERGLQALREQAQ